MTTANYNRLDQWIDAHFDEQVSFLQSVLSVPTDTPPGNNTPHALHTAELLKKYDMQAQAHAVPAEIVHAAGLESITNLIVKRQYGQGGRVLALNAHGDVVPPGDGWTYPPYAGEIHDGKIYGRAAAVSKCDFSTYVFAVRALESLGVPLKGRIELQFTYDEEFGGELGPGWLLKNKLTQPDLAIAAGFSYQIITAHNGCLQLEVTVNGKMGHAAVPTSGVDALQAAVKIMNALYALNDTYKSITSKVPGINHPYLNIGLINGGTNTNVIPGKVVLKLDRRMIPEEDPAQVEQSLRDTIEKTWQALPGITVQTRRILLARALKPLAGSDALVGALQQHAKAIFNEDVPACGTPLYADARLYCEAGIPVVLYGAGPRTVEESRAKQPDERLDLEDLRCATKVIARTCLDLMS
ncbi:MAG: peptidase M20 [Alcaligenaceae bacterium]|nr:MAG: peptidase M20 [Alcaligenaceae bacterium]